jgi:Mrp family chromosome partitioning ATPase
VLKPAVAAPADAGAAAEIVLEQVPPAAGSIDLANGAPSLIAQLRPACLALSATAFAATAGRRDRLILVSSPSAGEGKSLTALHLALALSPQEGRPVLLVDGDPRTAGSSKALAWPPEPGLSDALAGAVGLEEVIGHTGLDNLSFLPPGSQLAALPGLLAGRQLAEMMRALLARQPAGLVVIDAPPLLSGIAAAALAAYAGQVLLLVRAGSTSQQALDESLRRLGERANLHCIFVRP